MMNSVIEFVEVIIGLDPPGRSLCRSKSESGAADEGA